MNGRVGCTRSNQITKSCYSIIKRSFTSLYALAHVHFKKFRKFTAGLEEVWTFLKRNNGDKSAFHSTLHSLILILKLKKHAASFPPGNPFPSKSW